MGQVLESTAKTSLSPGRIRDQNGQKVGRLGSQQASIPAGKREGLGGLKEPTDPPAKLHGPVPPPFLMQKGCFCSSRYARLRSKPLCVITDPRFLLGSHLFNHPFSFAFNTLSSVRGQKHSLYIQKDKSSLQQLLYLTKNTLGCHGNPGF